MLNRGLNKTVQQALKEVDVILFLIEPGVLDQTDFKILSMIPGETPVVLAINKVDLLKDKNKLLGYIRYRPFVMIKYPNEETKNKLKILI